MTFLIGSISNGIQGLRNANKVVILLALFYLILPVQAQSDAELLRNKLRSARDDEKAALFIELGNLYSKSLVDSAMWYAQMAESAYSGFKDKAIETKLFLLKGNIYFSKNEYDSSRVFVDDAIKIAETLDDKSILANGLFQSGNLHLLTGSYSKADSCLNKALELQKQFGSKQAEISTLSSMGNSFYKRGDLPAAIKKFEEVYSIAVEEKDTAHIAMSLNNIAAVNLTNSNYEAGIAAMHKSLALAKAKKDNYSISGTLLNMGQAYTNWKKYDEAIKYINESLPYIEELKNPNFVAYYNMLIANAYFQKGEFIKAIESLETALPIAHQHKNLNTESRILNLLADSYTGLSDYEKAISFYEQALSIKKTIGNTTGIAVCLSSMGTCYSKWGKSFKAIEHLEESNKIATKLNIHEIAMDNYKWLAIEYEKQNNIPKAYQHFKEYKTLEDSIFSEKSNEQISELQLKYETERKENEILSLNEKNATQALEISHVETRNNLYLIIGVSILMILILTLYFYRSISQKRQLLKKKNEELEELNKIKNHFFSVVAHDLKSHITTFQSAGKIMEHHIEQKKYDTAHEFARHIENESEKLNNMLSNLLKWSITQLHGYNIRAEKLVVNSEVQTICNTFLSTAQAKNIRLVNKIESGLEAWADKGSFHVVLRNLISNAIKYSSDGQVLITAKLSNGFVNISVEDCGSGISPEIENLLFEIGEEKIVKGTAGERGTGLGLLLVKQFTELNKGRLSFKNSDRGAVFTVGFPNS